MLIRVTGSQNAAQVEQELQQLVQSSQVDLQIPVHPAEWWLGGELALVELINTWARLNDTGALVTHIPIHQDPNAQLRRMARRSFGFNALMMAPEIKDVSKTDRSLRPEAYRQCQEIVQRMYDSIDNLAFGTKLMLFCVDHSTLWALPWLYSREKAVHDRGEFEALARQLAKKTSYSYTGKDSPIPESLFPRFAAILHELFKNTHEWARHDHEGKPWRRSVRGISAERHKKSLAELSAVAMGSPALRSYFDSLLARTGADHLTFVEFTVFDGGIGLARSFLKDDWTPDIPLSREYAACMDCLTKHKTSSNKSHKGLGLAEVFSTLATLDAFIKIRTGRLSLYRDFVNSPFNGDVAMWDVPSSTMTPTELTSVFGAYFQILIPVFAASS